MTDGRVRMSGKQRREQLIQISRKVFAKKGYDGTSVEEIAQRASVSKPVVYEHFGGKEGIYAVVVDREVQNLLDRITRGLRAEHPREKLIEAAEAFLSYIEDEPDGFTILARGSTSPTASGTFASLLGDVASQVDYVLEEEFSARGFDKKLAPLYSRALVGMVAQVGLWWLDTGKPKRASVAAHLVNVAWNGLGHLESDPSIKTKNG
ncbi:MAG: hypothetical protein QOK47_978 [Actinomycetota bacterium]|nr:hypothetical protein [Actinomycetota bacterium]